MKLKTVGPPETGAKESAPRIEAVPELHLNRIIAAIDFSECSRKALHYSASFGRQFNAEILLLHVSEPPPPQVNILEGALMDTTLREDDAVHLEEWRRALGTEINAKAIIRDGTPAYRGIVAVAADVNADLIIVGNHGRKGLGRALMGSTAEKVVRFAPCPVLVVRDREHDFVSR